MRFPFPKDPDDIIVRRGPISRLAHNSIYSRGGGAEPRLALRVVEVRRDDGPREVRETLMARPRVTRSGSGMGSLVMCAVPDAGAVYICLWVSVAVLRVRVVFMSGGNGCLWVIWRRFFR